MTLKQKVSDATCVVPSTNNKLRIFASGGLPTSLFSAGIEEGNVFLTTRRNADEVVPLNTILKVQGKFQGEDVDLDLPIAKYTPEIMNSFESATELAISDNEKNIDIIATNDQVYRSEEGTASSFIKDFVIYLGTRFKLCSGAKSFQITPLELTQANGQQLYEAVIDALKEQDVVAALEADEVVIKDLQEFLRSNCCWYDTIDDRITPQRIVEDSPDADGYYQQTVIAEPYASLHVAKAHVSQNAIIEGADHLSKLSAPFEGNKNVAEVKDLSLYADRKLGLLNAVHIFIVIEALRDVGINSFAEIKSLEHVEEVMPDSVTVYESMKKRGTEKFDKISKASDTILAILEAQHGREEIDFKGFLESTYERFENPFVNHMLHRIFQSMDKFPPKIEERIGAYIDRVEAKPDSFPGILNSEGFEILKEFRAFLPKE